MNHSDSWIYRQETFTLFSAWSAIKQYVDEKKKKRFFTDVIKPSELKTIKSSSKLSSSCISGH